MNAYLKWRAGLPLDIEERAELRDYKRALRHRVDRFHAASYYYSDKNPRDLERSLKCSQAAGAAEEALEELKQGGI